MGKILIVDDDVLNSKLYAAKLQTEGHQVSVCHDGKEALGKVNEKFDLILLDIMMPKIPGTEILIELRKGINKSSKILVFTNLVNEETKKECLENGADEVLFKTDFTPMQLLEKTRALLK